MIQCKQCSWKGSRGDLLIDPVLSINIAYLCSLDNWNKCPKCLTTLPVSVSATTISIQHRGSVISINPTNNDILSRPTFLHLGRILDFSISDKKISFLGYKSYDTTFPFKLQINLENTDFESQIILKIVNILHKLHFRCERKTYKGYELFGSWGIMRNDYPLRICSFCARFYEFETGQINGWPLSISTIEKIKMDTFKSLANVPLSGNNKFSNIFNPQNKPEKLSICCCNEISRKPNEYCSIHDKTNVVGFASSIQI